MVHPGTSDREIKSLSSIFTKAGGYVAHYDSSANRFPNDLISPLSKGVITGEIK